MLHIIDHQILEHLKREKEQQKFFQVLAFSSKKIWNKASNIRLLVFLLLFAFITGSQVLFPSLLGMQTLYGASLEANRSLTGMNNILADKNGKIAELSSSIAAMHQLKLPPAFDTMLAVRADESLHYDAIANLYRMLEEIFPRNFAEREMVLNRILVDTEKQLMIIDGQARNDETAGQKAEDGTGTGYALIAKLIAAANASSYFMKSQLQEAKIDENNKNLLIYRIVFPFQSSPALDPQDSDRNIIEHREQEQEVPKVKRK